jgi:hypothetical protein
VAPKAVSQEPLQQQQMQAGTAAAMATVTVRMMEVISVQSIQIPLSAKTILFQDRATKGKAHQLAKGMLPFALLQKRPLSLSVVPWERRVQSMDRN